MTNIQEVSFDLQVKEEINRLKLENQNIEEEIKPKQQKVEENIKKIDHLTKYLSIAIPEKKTESIVGLRRRRRPINFNNTFEDVALKVLKNHGEPLHYVDLKKKMENEENYIIGGKDPDTNMTAHLSNSDKIVRFDRGIYGLKEWKEKNEGSEPSKHPEPSS